MDGHNKLKNSTVLVTGGAGFLGSHLCEHLLGYGARVIAFDNLSTGKLSNIGHISKNPDFQFIQGDCNKFEDIAAVFAQNKIDYIFHYAALVGVKRTIENPLAVLDDLKGIEYILDLARGNGIKKVVYASSSEVYGNPVELPEKEDGPTNAKMPYALVKLTGEQYMRAYFEKYGLPTCSLRFFNVYGPRQESSDYGFVAGIFMQQVISGKRPTIFGDGSQTRDFVFVEDNIKAGIAAMFSDAANGESINIGTCHATTVLELAEKIIVLGDRKDLMPEFLPARKIEIWHRWPQVQKMRQLLDFRPQFTLEDGLKKTYLINAGMYSDYVEKIVGDKKPIVVVFSCFYEPYMSGAELAVKEVARRLTDKYRIVIVTAKLDGKTPRRETLDGCEIVRVGIGFRFNKFLYPLFAPFAAMKFRPAIVHAVMESYAGIALWLYRALTKKTQTILTLQSGDLDMPEKQAKMNKFIWKKIHTAPYRIVAISGALADRAKKLGAENVEVIPNGVDFTEVRNVVLGGKKLHRIISVARLSSEKGLPYIIEALKKIKESFGDAELVLVGDGAERAALEKLAKREGLENSVKFMGRLPHGEALREVAKADVFVLASLGEGMGIVVAEAQALGVPVVATNVGGISDVVSHEKTGLLVPSKDARAIAEAVLRMFREPEFSRSLAENARETVKQFDWDKIAEKYDQLYLRLL